MSLSRHESILIIWVNTSITLSSSIMKASPSPSTFALHCLVRPGAPGGVLWRNRVLLELMWTAVIDADVLACLHTHSKTQCRGISSPAAVKHVASLGGLGHKHVVGFIIVGCFVARQ